MLNAHVGPEMMSGERDRLMAWRPGAEGFTRDNQIVAAAVALSVLGQTNRSNDRQMKTG
jgi:hypothetical protein